MINQKIKIKNLIINGEFYKAKIEIKKYSLKELEDFILLFANQTDNISFYSFMCFLISIKDNSHYHYITSVLLATTFIYMNGASNTAFFHAREAIRLDSDNKNYHKWALYFYNNPDILIEKDVMKKYLSDIIKEDSLIKDNLIKEESCVTLFMENLRTMKYYLAYENLIKMDNNCSLNLDEINISLNYIKKINGGVVDKIREILEKK